MLSRSGYAREEKKGGKYLSWPEAHWNSTVFLAAASVGLEHSFPRSRGKPVFLVHLRLAHQSSEIADG